MKTIVNFETAKLLKKKGFDKNTISRYYEWKNKSRMPDFSLPFYKNSMLFKDKELVSSVSYNTKNEDGYTENHKQVSCINWNNKSDAIYNVYSAPTIVEVVMWLYEKHEIWVDVSLSQFSKPNNLSWMYSIVFTKDCTYSHSPKAHNSPREAYQEAINYTLKNLIK